VNEIAPVTPQGDTLEEFLGGERLGIGEIFAGAAFEIGATMRSTPPG